MWQKTFTKTYPNVTKEAIWHAWADVASWPVWDTELEYCEMKSDFDAGNQFILKPKAGPKIKIILSSIIPFKTFTDYCCFPGARMYEAHFLEETPEGLKITNTITVRGLLSFLWVHLVAKKVAASVPAQTDNLVRYAAGRG